METILILALSLAVASFLNVVIYRLPRGESLVFPPSHCPECGTPIPWYLNVPVLGYIVLRGRSACCKKPISLRYLFVEVSYPILVLCSYLKFGLSIAFISTAIFVACALVTAIIDLYTMDVYDSTTIYPAMAILTLHLMDMRTIPWSHIMVALGSAGFVLLLNCIHRWLRGVDGIGTGDAGVMFLMGAYFGLKGTLLSFMIAAVLASIVGLYLLTSRRRSSPYPFAPFLCTGSIIVIFYGDAILSFYVKKLGLSV